MKFDALGFISELVRFKSVSADSSKKSETRACAEFLDSTLRGLGFDSRLLETGGNPVVFARKNCASKNPKARVMCYGHYDVQPAEPLDKWKTPPFEPTVMDGKIWGRGTADNKGPFTCLLAGLVNFLSSKPDADIDFGIAIEGEEEIGSGGISRLVRESPELFSGYDYIVLSDTSSVSETQTAVTIGLRGMGGFEAVFKGPDTDVHSGMFGGAVYNPLRAMFEVCASLHTPDGFVNVPEFYEDLPKLSDWEKSQIAKYPFTEDALKSQLGVDSLMEQKGYTVAESMRVLPTLEFSGVGGGYQGEGAKSIIPSECFCKISCRTVPGQDTERALASVKNAMLDRCPKGIKLSFIDNDSSGNAYFVDPKAEVSVASSPRQIRLSKAFAAVDKCAEKCFGEAPLYLREGASIPLISTIKQCTGLDCIMVGLFSPSDNLHAPNEGFSLSTIKKGVLYYEEFFSEISK